MSSDSRHPSPKASPIEFDFTPAFIYNLGARDVQKTHVQEVVRVQEDVWEKYKVNIYRKVGRRTRPSQVRRNMGWKSGEEYVGFYPTNALGGSDPLWSQIYREKRIQTCIVSQKPIRLVLTENIEEFSIARWKDTEKQVKFKV